MGFWDSIGEKLSGKTMVVPKRFPLLIGEKVLIADELVDDRYKNYTVEFYPYSKKYFALLKGGYLKTDSDTGLVRGTSMTFAETFTSEKLAWRLIDLHIEQRTKPHVIVITR